MASTPPLQIRAVIRTPPTPLHGPAFDDFDLLQPRYSTRSTLRRPSLERLSTPEAVKELPRAGRPVASLSRQSSRSSTPNAFHLQSPQHSPKRKSSRRVQVVSPNSPGSPAYTSFASTRPHSSFLSSTTVMSDGMLPTPVKTPRKKIIPGVNAAARALFQDQPVLGEEVVSTSRRGRKGKRHNGFTLESFSAEDEGASDNIQIFTDSRDNVPQVDVTEDNPFVDHAAGKGGSSSKKVAGTSKRRKVGGERKPDPEVEEAIKQGDGMVFVQRGRKIYRKFDELDEEEEEIDTEDLGLLEHQGDTNTVKPFKTLTRKSYKPTRLFQNEEQKRAREAEKEEEALTDIEEQPVNVSQPASPLTPVKVTVADIPATPPSSARALRSTTKKEVVDANEASASAHQLNNAKKPKRSSPFDSWKRIKAASTASTNEVSKSRKRGSDVLDDDTASATKKPKV